MKFSFSKKLLEKINEKNIKIFGPKIYLTSLIFNDVAYNSKLKSIVLCKDQETAESLNDAFNEYSKIFGYSAFSSYTLPSWGMNPYLLLSPLENSTHQRIFVQSQAYFEKTKVIFCDIESFITPVLSFESFKKNIIEFKKNAFYPRHELESILLNLGYQRYELVEDSGQFCFRGNILDIFPTNSQLPYRVEFFGDDVEEIRNFDPETQRSFTQNLDSFFIAPNGFILNETKKSFSSRLKDYCDQNNISKKVRDEFLDSLSPNLSESFLEYYNSLFLEENKRSSVFDFFCVNLGFKLFTFNENEILQEFKNLQKKFNESFDEARKKEKLVLPPNLIFIEPEQITNEIKNKTATFESLSILDKNLDNSITLELLEIDNIDLKASSYDPFNFFIERSKALLKEGFRIIVTAPTQSQANKLLSLLENKQTKAKCETSFNENNTESIQIIISNLNASFQVASEKIIFFHEAFLFGVTEIKKRKKHKKINFNQHELISSLNDLESGDLIVHVQHGIGKYEKLIHLNLDGIEQDFLLIHYANNDKLYLPIYKLDQIQKYLSGTHSSLIKLDRLGSHHFEKLKAKIKSEIRDLAKELLEIYAKKELSKGEVYLTTDIDYEKFESQFPYPETDDQLKAIEDCINDLKKGKIMDRLICGDVGFGKTEVAMRVAYIIASHGKQVAVLVPTTVLVYQHEQTFKKRFEGTPINIASISRFKSKKEINEILEKTKTGKIDILIGTHRLLSKDVNFKSLGLLIIDEEQRFGVEHKEKIRALKENCNVLTLTATPIPRTLHLSLIGIRDISIINTPPIDRHEIKTFVSKFDESLIKKAIEFELERGGQVFFIHNRVQSISSMASKILDIIPNLKIGIAHGQMKDHELEKTMLNFYNKKINVLVCTSLIESGLDIPNANTMIINRADLFGLAETYQLRGRIGRSSTRAYCYLLLPEEDDITKDAKKRLEVIQKYTALGSGFKIASHDLELRGSGEILGKSQSGHITLVGYEMFLDLLNEAIDEIKNGKVNDNVTTNKIDTEIKLPISAFISEHYISNIHQRMQIYKRLSVCKNEEELINLEQELQDRFGKLPKETYNLIWIIRLKLLSQKHKIKSLVQSQTSISLEIDSSTDLKIDKILNLISEKSNEYSILPNSKILIHTTFESVEKTFHILYDFIELVA